MTEAPRAGPCVSCTPYSCHRDNVAGDSRLTGPEDRTMSDSYEFATHRCREIDAQHPEDRCQEALGLTQRSVEDETER